MPQEKKTAICLLIINKVKTMPMLAISSILAATSNDIYLGYLNVTDIEDIPTHPRIKPIQLSEVEGWSVTYNSRANYVDFLAPEFYKLVQYKWLLLQTVFRLGFDSVIFSDFDLIWNLDPTSSVNETFTNFPEVDIQIQTYTSNPSQERLCMGFVAFRNSQNVINDLDSLRHLHAELLQKNAFCGDDDVISTMYKTDLDFRKRVRLLPQSTFPTGNLINVFARRNLFPGLIPYAPYVFHANFVVGSKKKILLMRLFQMSISSRSWHIRNVQFFRVRLELIFRRVGVFIKQLLR